MELKPADTRSEGLVQWLFLNKKLNHWKSTRATSRGHLLGGLVPEADGGARRARDGRGRGLRPEDDLHLRARQVHGQEEPDRHPGRASSGRSAPTVKVTKGGKGLAFASATWHFSTDRMPEKGDGDLFAVERTYFKREKRGEEVVLKPLAEGAALAVGDEIEVQLSIRARHQAEYVHLRDPRPSGCEPVTLRSGYKWDLGLGALRGDPRQRHELLRRVAARGRVHAQAPHPVRDGRDVQGRAGDAAVDVRARVRGLFGGGADNDQVRAERGEENRGHVRFSTCPRFVVDGKSGTCTRCTCPRMCPRFD
ncbi:MAG: hypothetical protein M0C28_41760 [Candidatus Moduliflexus flocculans]|nr:hypothetical protein [Candidatus Moduliflexus flocculans]